MVITKKAVETEYIIEKYSNFVLEFDIIPKNPSFYILAFIHRSLVNERPDFAPEHNERLEFLWDAVLELATTENLFLDFPEKAEGDLTDIRSWVVRGRNLAKIAWELNFADYLILWKWEESSGWRENDYLLANVTEAFIWAIYLDHWFKEAKKFIDKYIYPSVHDIIKFNLLKDYKTTIQEFIQAEFDVTPTYKVLGESGLDHEKTFEVGVFMWEKQVGFGVWASKKKAQEKAAEDGFNNLQKK